MDLHPALADGAALLEQILLLHDFEVFLADLNSAHVLGMPLGYTLATSPDKS